MPPTVRVRQRIPAPVSESLLRLGERLRKARIDAGLSQAKLAAPHFTRAYISAVEKGKVRPAMGSLEFLAGKLGKSVSYFMEDEGRERQRVEREAAIARSVQLVAEGLPAKALAELQAIDLDGLRTPDRLAVKRVLARAHLENGGASKATVLFGEVLRGYEALGNDEMVARVSAELGRALIGTMSYEEAEAHLSRALGATASGVVKDPLFRVHVLYNLGRAFYQRGDYKAALDQYERALAEGSDISDQKWLASVHAAMGMSLREVGDLEGAITNLRKSETLFEAIRNRSRVAEIRFQLAHTIWEIGNHTKAIAVASEALEASKAAGNQMLSLRIEGFIGMCEARTGSTDQAANRLRRVVEEADAFGEIRARFAARLALAKALGEKAPLEAERLLRETESLLSGPSHRDDLRDVFAEMSRVLMRQDRTEEALKYSQRALEAARDAQKGGLG